MSHLHTFIRLIQSGANRSDRDDFLSEAAILGQFSDPNVVSIEGVVLKGKIKSYDWFTSKN